jgi:hypothetical protein
MKIKVLQKVNLDFTGEKKEYSNGTHKIDDKLAIKNNYVDRYQKYPKHIEIIEFPTEEKVNETVIETEEKPKKNKK